MPKPAPPTSSTPTATATPPSTEERSLADPGWLVELPYADEAQQAVLEQRLRTALAPPYTVEQSLDGHGTLVLDCSDQKAALFWHDRTELWLSPDYPHYVFEEPTDA